MFWRYPVVSFIAGVSSVAVCFFYVAEFSSFRGILSMIFLLKLFLLAGALCTAPAVFNGQTEWQQLDLQYRVHCKKSVL